MINKKILPLIMVFICAVLSPFSGFLPVYSQPVSEFFADRPNSSPAEISGNTTAASSDAPGPAAQANTPLSGATPVTADAAAVATPAKPEIKPILSVEEVEGSSGLFTMELRNAELGDIFRLLARDHGLNVIIDPAVSGTITASFSRITLDEAVDFIAEQAMLKVEKKKNMIRVRPDLKTRVFQLEHIEAKDLISSEKTSSPLPMIPVADTSAPAMTAKSIFDLLSSHGSIFLGKQPNSLLVVDYEPKLEKVAEYIAMADQSLETRVFTLKHIEAHVLLEGASSLTAESAGSGTALGQPSADQADQNAGTGSFPGFGGTSSESNQVKMSSIYDLLSRQGKILLGQQPNSLMVMDYRQNLKRIADYLTMVDRPLETAVITLKYLKASDVVNGVSGQNEEAEVSSDDEDARLFETRLSQSGSGVKALLSSLGKLMFGDSANSIVVIDYPRNVEKIRDFLSAIDIAPKQVIIEARVVEVDLSGDHALGVNWQAFAQNNGFELGQFQIGSTYPGSPGSLVQAIDYKNTVWKPGAETGTDQDPFTFAIFDDNINVVVKALSSTLDTNILSAPRIATVNNNPAAIKIIEKRPWAEPQLTEGESGNVNITWDVHFEEIGIILKVTPIVNSEGTITMLLEPEISEKVDDFTLTVENGGVPIDYDIPIIDTRQASTKLVVRNGQTLIIGGLIKDKRVKEATKVPLLGDVPILGAMFKSTRNVDIKQELLIFVSPTIIDDNYFFLSERQEKRLGSWYQEDITDYSSLDSELDRLLNRQQEVSESRKKLQALVE